MKLRFIWNEKPVVVRQWSRCAIGKAQKKLCQTLRTRPVWSTTASSTLQNSLVNLKTTRVKDFINLQIAKNLGHIKFMKLII